MMRIGEQNTKFLEGDTIVEGLYSLDIKVVYLEDGTSSDAVGHWRHYKFAGWELSSHMSPEWELNITYNLKHLFA